MFVSAWLILGPQEVLLPSSLEMFLRSPCLLVDSGCAVNKLNGAC